jgi:hypothetical protein
MRQDMRGERRAGPRPLADHRAGNIADVVLVEQQKGSQIRSGQRLAQAAQPVGVQAGKVHPLFEVHLHVAGGLERAVPAVPGVSEVTGSPSHAIKEQRRAYSLRLRASSAA